MDRQSAARLRYDRLKKTLADDQRIRRKARRARALGMAAVGAWLIVPVYFWDVHLEEAAVPEFFRAPAPHEAYLLALNSGGAELPTSAGIWETAANTAIDRPASVGAAYQEIGTFLADQPHAVGIRVRVPEGQRLRLTIGGEGEEGRRVFIDLFRAAPDSLVEARSGTEPRPAFLGGEEWAGHTWTFDSDRTAEYVLRIQPALSHRGNYRIAMQVGAPWRFPVAGAGESDIGSVFGDPRDGGGREHHGVDIFAPRGTPVLAAADGNVTSVDTTEIGGRVVWQREDGGRHSLYYAHLDRPLVREGQHLRAGDTVGLVGNTGNARTTPPHLHFGAYRRGARDPWNLILPIPPALPEVAVDPEILGQAGQVRGSGVRLVVSPSPRGAVVAELSDHAALRVVAASGAWYRVLLPDGASGFIAARDALPATANGNNAADSTVGEG